MLDVIWRTLLGMSGLAILASGGLALLGRANGQTTRGDGLYGVLVPADSLPLAVTMVVLGAFMLGLLVLVLLRARA